MPWQSWSCRWVFTHESMGCASRSPPGAGSATTAFPRARRSPARTSTQRWRRKMPMRRELLHAPGPVAHHAVRHRRHPGGHYPRGVDAAGARFRPRRGRAQHRPDRVYQADEAFFCGTGVQVAPIIEVDGRPVGSGKPGSITQSLQDAYFRAVRGNDPRYRQWCTPVYGGMPRITESR